MPDPRDDLDVERIDAAMNHECPNCGNACDCPNAWRKGGCTHPCENDEPSSPCDCGCSGIGGTIHHRSNP